MNTTTNGGPRVLYFDIDGVVLDYEDGPKPRLVRWGARPPCPPGSGSRVADRRPRSLSSPIDGVHPRQRH
jgi:hypothetical protein